MFKHKSVSQRTKDLMHILSNMGDRLIAASRVEDVQDVLTVLEGLSNDSKAPLTARTMYGLAYLMEGKPWYDFETGFDALVDAAESADESEAFCWYALGLFYLVGRPEMPADPVSAKYWIDKAADVGDKDAINLRNARWR